MRKVAFPPCFVPIRPKNSSAHKEHGFRKRMATATAARCCPPPRQGRARLTTEGGGGREPVFHRGTGRISHETRTDSRYLCTHRGVE